MTAEQWAEKILAAQKYAAAKSLEPDMLNKLIMVYLNRDGEPGAVFYTMNRFGTKHIIDCNGAPAAAAINGKCKRRL